MFAIVERSLILRHESPSPPYSKTLPRPPFTVYRRSISRITSFAETPGRSFPLSSTRTTAGIFIYIGSPAIAMATSRPPAPIASIPIAPPVGVWLSEPSSVFPGTPNLSKWTVWQMPFPAFERKMPYFLAIVCR